MKIINSAHDFTVTLLPEELWIISKRFSSGLMVGVTNPFEGLSAQEEINQENQTIKFLIAEGALKLDSDGHLFVDELIGAMVYSLSHSYLVVTIIDKTKNNDIYLHVLPDWLMICSNIEGVYVLTLFRSFESLWDYLKSKFGTPLLDGLKGLGFVVSEREMELSAALYESGQKKKATAIFQNNNSINSMDLNSLLDGYLNADIFYDLNAIYYRNDVTKVYQRINSLFQFEDKLFWVEHVTAGEVGTTLLKFIPMDSEKIKKAFFNILQIN